MALDECPCPLNSDVTVLPLVGRFNQRVEIKPIDYANKTRAHLDNNIATAVGSTHTKILIYASRRSGKILLAALDAEYQ